MEETQELGRWPGKEQGALSASSRSLSALCPLLMKENNKKQLDKNHEKRKKPVMTPDGEFDSVRAAAKHYGKNETTIMNRLVKKWPGYFYIEKT